VSPPPAGTIVPPAKVTADKPAAPGTGAPGTFVPSGRAITSHKAPASDKPTAPGTVAPSDKGSPPDKSAGSSHIDDGKTGSGGSPSKTAPSPRFVGSRTADPDDERDDLGVGIVPAPRRRKVTGRLFILLVVLLLALGAAGGWYYQKHRSSSGPAAPTAAQKLAAVTLAGHVNIQATDLPGWTATPGSPGNAFSAGAAKSPAAKVAQATTTMARCLNSTKGKVNRAFGTEGPSSVARSAQVPSSVYADPSAAGVAASSVVDVMSFAKYEHADFSVFANPTTFTTCYQPYAEALLPATPPFTSVAVTPVALAPPANAAVHVEAFQITRTGTDAGAPVSVTTTAVAIFGGRVQATLTLAGPAGAAGFPSSTQAALVQAVEGRVAATLPA
jgi:hypothetical protein